MKLREAGLLSKWYKDYSPDLRECYDNVRAKTQREQLSHEFVPLVIKRLTGGFAALLIGYFAALLIFIGQRFHFHCYRKAKILPMIVIVPP